MCRRTCVLVLLVAVAAPSAFASRSGPAARTVPCDEAIGTTAYPYLGNNQREHRYRRVLDAIAVPPAYMHQVVATGERPWAYWRKQGLIVRTNAARVTITVPAAWRDRIAIAWGYRGKGEPFSVLRIAGRCGTDDATGRAYSGGFYLRANSACVPLTFQIGTRKKVVRFGVGKRCR